MRNFVVFTLVSVIFLAGADLLSGAAMADESGSGDSGRLITESGNSQVYLIELYTSEGCSSCPRADEWLSGFVDHPRLWDDYIPLSFHVDYWDFLGWKDRYSDAAYSARQRSHKRYGNLDAVYTPGVLVNGQEWRGLLERQPWPARLEPAPGNLKLVVETNSAGLAFSDAIDRDNPLLANLVILGTGIENRIGRGENAGRTLQHDFVVLKHLTQTGAGFWHFEYELPEDATAIAGWLSDPDDLTPVQAVGTWLPSHSE